MSEEEQRRKEVVQVIRRRTAYKEQKKEKPNPAKPCPKCGGYSLKVDLTGKKRK